MNNPLVSILAPCFNGEKTVSVFLNSVLGQTYDNIELYLIDDGSEDRTKSIVLSYENKFQEKGYTLHYLYQNNSGQAAAINLGLRLFSGEYIMWSDSDDILLPENVSSKVQYLVEHQNYGFILGKEGVVEATDLDKIIRVNGRVLNGSEDSLFKDIIDGKNIVYGPGTVMVRRDVLLRCIPKREIYSSREGQNIQLLLPLAYSSKCGYLDAIIMKRVLYPDSHSRRMRTYREIMERNDGVKTLICETLDSIPDMGARERNYWKRYIIVKYSRYNLRRAYENDDKECVEEYKKELRDYNAYTWKCSKAFYGIQTMIRKIIKCQKIKII